MTQSAIGRILSPVIRTRMQAPTIVERSDREIKGRALDAEISLAAGTDLPVLVTADTLAAANQIAAVIRERLEPTRGPVVVLNCAIVGDSIIELLGKCAGVVILEDVASLGDRAQSGLSAFVEKQLLDIESAQSGLHMRLIATALTDVYTRVKHGLFRSDLFYRLNAIHIAASSAAAEQDGR
jgi:transcriptional regulator of acetoin/glycerol metabolism